MKGKKRAKVRAIFSRLGMRPKMSCLYPTERFKINDKLQSSDCETARDCSSTGCLYQIDSDGRTEKLNINEAESSLQEGIGLNNEEARALLGRLEYQRGNVEAALTIFDGIDIASIAPKIKISIMKRLDRKFLLHKDILPVSIHAASLLLEAIYLKSRALQDLGRYKEAAQTCTSILDTVESATISELPGKFGSDYKLREIVGKAVELLPELWKLAGSAHEAILSYRRALLGRWNLDPVTCTRIQKEFAIYLLYGGCDTCHPALCSQMDDSFVPRNNIEEAILLLMILLRKFNLKRAERDLSIVHHLTFALSVSGGFKALANQVEELLPGIVDRKERYYTLALCYLGEGDNTVAFYLLKKLLSSRDDPNSLRALLLASKICAESGLCTEAVSLARRSLDNWTHGCFLMGSVANYLLGISLSAQARFGAASYLEKDSLKFQAVTVLMKAYEMSEGRDYDIVFNLCLETAEQRNLDLALKYVKELLRIESGCNIRTWVLCARILSAQKRYPDAETIVNAALDETGAWNQAELLQIKAKIEVAQEQWNNAIKTYSHLLGVLQLKARSSAFGTQTIQNDRSLEMETWHNLANIYIRTFHWSEAEACISKLKKINSFSALVCHVTGNLFAAKGLHREALQAYFQALYINPKEVPSMISAADVLRKMDGQLGLARQLLTDALVLDRTNHVAWFNLGLLYKAQGDICYTVEASDCFQTAVHLEETAPVEPFR